jgi:hypothetical protein
MAACNVDSRLFIGAVSRVITEMEEVVPRAGTRGRAGLIALFPDGYDVNVDALRGLPGLRGLTRYHVREQGAAPNSTVPHLPVTVGGVAQAWFDSLVDLECALTEWGEPGAGLFVVEEHWLTGSIERLHHNETK